MYLFPLPVSIAVVVVSANKRHGRRGVRAIFGNCVLLVPDDAGRRALHGRQRRHQVVDRSMPAAFMDGGLLHRHEGYTELWKGKRNHF